MVRGDLLSQNLDEVGEAFSTRCLHAVETFRSCKNSKNVRDVANHGLIDEAELAKALTCLLEGKSRGADYGRLSCSCLEIILAKRQERKGFVIGPARRVQDVYRPQQRSLVSPELSETALTVSPPPTREEACMARHTHQRGGEQHIGVQVRSLLFALMFIVLPSVGSLVSVCHAADSAAEVVKVTVRQVGFDPVSRSPVLILEDEAHTRAMPIWIGSSEARAIELELRGEPAPRPLTHDLVKNILEHVGVVF